MMCNLTTQSRKKQDSTQKDNLFVINHGTFGEIHTQVNLMMSLVSYTKLV